MPRNPDKIDYSRGFPEGFEAFGSLRDPRNGGNTHNLVRPEGDNPKRPKSLPKREPRATLDPDYLEKLLSLV